MGGCKMDKENKEFLEKLEEEHAKIVFLDEFI